MNDLILTRRKVLFGLLAAPLVVKAASLMPVKIPLWTPEEDWLVSETTWQESMLPGVTTREQAWAMGKMELLRQVTQRRVSHEVFFRDILPHMKEGDLATCLRPATINSEHHAPRHYEFGDSVRVLRDPEISMHAVIQQRLVKLT